MHEEIHAVYASDLHLMGGGMSWYVNVTVACNEISTLWINKHSVVLYWEVDEKDVALIKPEKEPATERSQFEQVI